MNYDPEIEEVLNSSNKHVNAYESVNGGYKNTTNYQLNWDKYKAISELKLCRVEDSPKEIARLLSSIFEQWKSIDGYWTYISQTYTPRVINWVLSDVVKEYKRGGIKITPAHYFSYLLTWRKKKKTLTATIGSHKQQFSKKLESEPVSAVEDIFGGKLI